MDGSAMAARAFQSAAGGNLRSSLRSASISSAITCHFSPTGGRRSAGAAQRVDPAPDFAGARRMLRAGVLEERPVVLDGARPFPGLVVQRREIEMRRRVPRIERQRTEQRFLGLLGAAGCLLDEREIHAGVDVARILRQDTAKLHGGL